MDNINLHDLEYLHVTSNLFFKYVSHKVECSADNVETLTFVYELVGFSYTFAITMEYDNEKTHQTLLGELKNCCYTMLMQKITQGIQLTKEKANVD